MATWVLSSFISLKHCTTPHAINEPQPSWPFYYSGPYTYLLYPLDLPLVCGQLWHPLKLLRMCAVNQSTVWVVLYQREVHAATWLHHGQQLHWPRQHCQLPCDCRCITNTSLHCKQRNCKLKIAINKVCF